MSWKFLPQDPSPPQRPEIGGYGTKGSPITLTTNHFLVDVKNKNLILYHYDVAIKDHKGEDFKISIPKSKNMAIFEEFKKSLPKIFSNSPMSYDSTKNAYSTILFHQFKSPQSYSVSLDGERRDPEAAAAGGGKKGAKKKFNKNNYIVNIVKVNQASLKELFDCMNYVPGTKIDLPTTILQMIEVMFRHHRAVKYTQISSRNFFSVDGEFAHHQDIGGGKIGVTGFFGSLRPAAWKDGSILLNLDMAHTAFYQEMPVMQFLQEVEYVRFDGTVEDARTLRNMAKNLKGLKVRVNYGNRRTYKVYDIHKSGPNTTKFDFEDDRGKRKITVQEYFQNHYGINLQYPSFNCLNVGNQNKQVYIPAELCRIDKGQKVKKKLSEKEVKQFIRSTAVQPHERLRQIKSVASKNSFGNDPMLKAMSFTISDQPMETEGRILPPPGLIMKNEKFLPNYGVWDVRNRKFHNPATLNKWAVLNYDFKTNKKTIQKFTNTLVGMGRSKGMTISEPFDIYDGGRNPQPHDDLKYYKEKNPDIQMVMCILPGRKFYGAIKKAGDTQINIITQCVQSLNVFKCQDQTIGNILLKINAKMDGVNNIVTIDNSNAGLMTFAEPYMIMGADVNHPPAGGDASIPSIAAVVGSYDKSATKYAVERRAQYHRVEVIESMKEITRNLLLNFYSKTNKVVPKRIIMFRDGVSESQFSTVLSKEMLAMREACTSMQKDGAYKPGITFICVQKRHHTRLFCDERYVGNQRNKNVPPGTIVDRVITHPTETDFFLCSHQGIQGTSKPTHYHLLWDDNDLPINELQALTYNLCHVYSRCARSVSIPTPVYYAHLAAFRAKVFVTEMLGSDSESGSVMSGDNGRAEQLRVDIVNTIRVAKEDPLSSKLHYI